MDTEFEKKAVAPLMHIYIRNRKYFQRNAAIAMGNSGDAEMVSYLADAMRDPEELVRAHSAWALGNLGGSKAKAILESCLRSENSEQAKREIIDALERA